jgi:hypothetical protein
MSMKKEPHLAKDNFRLANLSEFANGGAAQ